MSAQASKQLSSANPAGPATQNASQGSPSGTVPSYANGSANIVRNGYQHLKGNRLEEAEALFKEGLACEPIRINCLNGLLRLARRKGNDGQALEYLVALCQAEPGNFEHRLDLAGLQRKLGEVDAALATCRDVLAQDPRNAKAHATIASAWHSRGDNEAALAHVRAAVDLAPENLQFRLRLIELLLTQNKSEEACAACRAAIALHPNDVKVLVRLGTISQRLNDWESAVTCLKAASDADPSNLELLLRLGRTCIDAARLDEAEEIFRAALRVAPVNDEAMVELGVVARLRGNDRAAMEFFREAAKVAPSNERAIEGIATLERDRGDFDWIKEIEEYVSAIRNAGAPPAARLKAAGLLIRFYGITDTTAPLLEELEATSQEARKLLVTAQQLDRLGLSQAWSGRVGFSGSNENMHAPFQGFLAKPKPGSDTLLIAFGGRHNRGWMTYSLMHRIFRRTEASIVYVRDLKETWYLRGIVGLGEDFPSTVESFLDLKNAYGAKRILTFGNSVDCHAALRYGLALGADGVLGLAPILRPSNLLKPRYLARARMVLASLEEFGDLRREYAAVAKRPSVTLIFGEQAEPDAADASHFGEIAGVNTIAMPSSSSHDAIHELLVRGFLESVLREFAERGALSEELAAQIRMSGSG